MHDTFMFIDNTKWAYPVLFCALSEGQSMTFITMICLEPLQEQNQPRNHTTMHVRALLLL